MSDLKVDILRILRIFGPCSNADVARRLKIPSHKTYRALSVLVAQGLVTHPKFQRWDISYRGRKWFDQPLFDGPRIYGEG